MLQIIVCFLFGARIWIKKGCFDRKNELEIFFPLREHHQINIEEVK
jgi:hypothetical protein